MAIFEIDALNIIWWRSLTVLLVSSVWMKLKSFSTTFFSSQLQIKSSYHIILDLESIPALQRLNKSNSAFLCLGIQKGHWVSVEEAAVEMKAYMVEKMMEDQSHSRKNDKLEEEMWVRALKEGNLRLPSQAQILEDGRRDLRYVLQVRSLLVKTWPFFLFFVFSCTSSGVKSLPILSAYLMTQTCLWSSKLSSFLVPERLKANLGHLLLLTRVVLEVLCFPTRGPLSPVMKYFSFWF